MNCCPALNGWLHFRPTIQQSINPTIHFCRARRVVHGEKQTHLTQNQAALDVQVVSRRPFRPQSIVSDALAR